MRSDIDAILMRIAAGARLTGAAWVALLVALTYLLFEDDIDRSLVPLATAVVVGAWSIVAIRLFRSEPSGHVSTPALTLDAIVAAGALLASGSVGAPAPTFSGGLPLIVVAIAAIAGRRQAAVMTVLMIVATLVARTGGFVEVGGVTGSISSMVLYVVGAGILVWVVETLRASDARRVEADEQRREAEANRARAEERIEISRHLHDSVLQTLALVQRRDDVPLEVTVLARRQERELRDWLFGRAPAEGSWAAALESAAAEVERDYNIPVEVVVSGDAELDDELQAIVEAGREAMTNAAVHSGATAISVFGEVVAGSARVFVRDRGSGFDPGAVSADRQGVRESIVGRMHSRGGSATVRSEPGFGTEWRLEVPR